jgi:hypothetical protein
MLRSGNARVEWNRCGSGATEAQGGGAAKRDVSKCARFARFINSRADKIDVKQ